LDASIKIADDKKKFDDLLALVNAWDQGVLENGARIAELHNSLRLVADDQARTMYQLGQIHTRQGEISSKILPFELRLKEEEEAAATNPYHRGAWGSDYSDSTCVTF
jgi:hypothetical protein